MPKRTPSAVRSTLSQRDAVTLREVADRLRAIQSVVNVAVAALRAQNADIDADIGRLLIRAVSDPLQAQVDSIKSVLRGRPSADRPLTRKKR